MNFNEQILNAVPAGDWSAATQLHEQLWLELLRQESADLHNVRLARVEGVHEGVRFVDPVLGHSRVYYTLFCQQLDASRKAELTAALVAAHRHSLACRRWTLLVSIELTPADVHWLVVQLRAAATAMDPSVASSIQECTIDHRDGRDLMSMAKRQLSVTAKYLPSLVQPFAEESEAQRTSLTRVEAQTLDRLRDVQESLIRQRATEGHAALAAVSSLNQGWAEQIASVSSLIAFPLRPEGGNIAESLLMFCDRRMRDALLAEGLMAGIASELFVANNKARQLAQAVAAGHGPAVSQLSNGLTSALKGLQARIGQTQLTILRPRG